jgi:hypothetical protein
MSSGLVAIKWGNLVCVNPTYILPTQTATCATYSINCLVFITELKSVYNAVRTGSLNKAVCVPSFKIQRHVRTEHLIHTYMNLQLRYVV